MAVNPQDDLKVGAPIHPGSCSDDASIRVSSDNGSENDSCLHALPHFLFLWLVKKGKKKSAHHQNVENGTAAPCGRSSFHMQTRSCARFCVQRILSLSLRLIGLIQKQGCSFGENAGGVRRGC